MKRNKKKQLFAKTSVLLFVAFTAFFVLFEQKVFSPASKNPLQSQSAPSPTPTTEVNEAQPDNSEVKGVKMQGEAPILMYHYIRDYNSPDDQIGTNLSVSPNTFAKQLDYLKQNGYNTTTFKEISEGKMPEKPVIITFDDGYLDFYQKAFPELVKREMKAVSFIIVGSIDKQGYMTKENILEISRNGVEIGSHTISHPDLSKSEITKIKKELFDSKKTLEEIIGGKIVSLCYPAGKYNDETINSAKEAGYVYATTTKNGLADFANNFELRRYRINPDTIIGKTIK